MNVVESQESQVITQRVMATFVMSTYGYLQASTGRPFSIRIRRTSASTASTMIEFFAMARYWVRLTNMFASHVEIAIEK